MGRLALTRPLAVLDLETTGVDQATARIIDVAVIKVHPDGRRERFVQRVHPGVPIPPESSRVHGVTDADVAGAPPFADVAAALAAFIGDADLAGFNIHRFDLPLLLQEFARAGVVLDMTGRAVVDAQVIFHRREPRDLAAAYRRYCGGDLVRAHRAEVDAEAVLEILDGQLAAYPDLPRTPEALGALFAPRDESRRDQGQGG